MKLHHRSLRELFGDYQHALRRHARAIVALERSLRFRPHGAPKSRKEVGRLQKRLRRFRKWGAKRYAIVAEIRKRQRTPSA